VPQHLLDARLHDARTGALLRSWPPPSLAFAVALGDGIAITRSEDPVTRFFDLETGEALGEVAGTTAPEDALRLALWDALSDGPVVARGRTEKDPLYVLKLHT
jgi:hypothetical protein